MNRKRLENFLGKEVEIVICEEDGILKGVLHKTGEEMYKDNPNLYIPKNYYFISPLNKFLFRTSHVLRIKEKKLY